MVICRPSRYADLFYDTSLTLPLCNSCAQDRLDPIDWATYEPYFWGNVQRYSQRVAILFGTLLQLQRALPDSAAAGSKGGAAAAATAMASSSSSDTNPLNLLPVAPRFQYLPISAPSAGGPSSAATSGAGLLLAGKHHHLQLGGSGTAPGGLAATSASVPTSSSDLAGNYSFADLGSANGGRSGDFAAAGGGGAPGGAASVAGGGLGEAATAGMAAGASALGALQVRSRA